MFLDIEMDADLSRLPENKRILNFKSGFNLNMLLNETKTTI